MDEAVVPRRFLGPDRVAPPEEEQGVRIDRSGEADPGSQAEGRTREKAYPQWVRRDSRHSAWWGDKGRVETFRGEARGV